MAGLDVQTDIYGGDVIRLRMITMLIIWGMAVAKLFLGGLRVRSNVFAPKWRDWPFRLIFMVVMRIRLHDHDVDHMGYGGIQNYFLGTFAPG